MPRATLFLLMATGCSTTIVLTKADLETSFASRFPIEKRALIAAVRLEHPRVLFEDDSDRIGFELDAMASLFDESHVGTAIVFGRLRYDAATGELFLIDPELVHLDLPDLPEEHREPIRSAASVVVAATLPTIPVHRIADPSQRAFIKSVKVKDGTVRVEVGI